MFNAQLYRLTIHARSGHSSATLLEQFRVSFLYEFQTPVGAVLPIGNPQSGNEGRGPGPGIGVLGMGA